LFGISLCFGQKSQYIFVFIIEKLIILK